jgi:triacylglycerol lipase
VHGTAADPTTWDASIANYLKGQNVPFDTNITLAPNGSVADNGRLLSKIVHDLATSFGVRKVHIVAHSKGGLDTRAFLGSDTLYNPWDDIRVLSLHTLSTPHHGAVLADLSVARRTLNDPSSNDPLIQSYLRWDWPLSYSSSVPQAPALNDLQTSSVLEFNRRTLFPLSTVLYTYGADADLDHDGRISDAEAAPLITTFGSKFGTLMYRVLRDVSSIKVERKTSMFGMNEYHLITPVATTAPQGNDIAVTDVSSMAHPLDTHFGPLARNHGNVKDVSTVQNILSAIRGDYPVF